MFRSNIITREDGPLLQRYSRLVTRTMLQRRANVAERALRKKAERTAQMKSDFIANMSHELRTPLNSVIGFSELIKDKDKRALTAEQVEEYAGLINTSAEQLLTIVNDILEISKIQSGRMTLHKEELDLADFVEETVQLLTLRADKMDVTLEVSIEPDLGTISADRTKLRQILLNFIDNAIKFNKPAGQVFVTGRRNGHNSTEIVIADTGIGMSAEDVKLSMTPFGQVDSTHTRKVGGTGLGVPISKALIELHRGEMKITSAPDVGTRINIILPVRGELHPVENSTRDSEQGE